MSPENQPMDAFEEAWEECTFEGAELAQLRHGVRLTFDEKVSWLEQAHRLSMQFQESRREKGMATIYADGRIES